MDGIKGLWEYLKEGFLNIIYPMTCENCGREIRESKGYSICEECINKIEKIIPPYCFRCGKPLSSMVHFEEEAICADCLNSKRSFSFVRSVTLYQGAIRKCIHLLKYKKQVKLIQPLGGLLIDFIKNDLFMKQNSFDLVVPVPLSRKQISQRGFNQSSLLAKQVADYYSIQFSDQLLLKKYNNKSQVGLSRKDRKKNVQNVYSLNKELGIKFGNILLFDDIYTTGSTIEACCSQLKKSMAKEIFVLTLSRQI